MAVYIVAYYQEDLPGLGIYPGGDENISWRHIGLLQIGLSSERHSDLPVLSPVEVLLSLMGVAESQDP